MSLQQARSTSHQSKKTRKILAPNAVGDGANNDDIEEYNEFQDTFSSQVDEIALERLRQDMRAYFDEKMTNDVRRMIKRQNELVDNKVDKIRSFVAKTRFSPCTLTHPLFFKNTVTFLDKDNQPIGVIDPKQRQFVFDGKSVADIDHMQSQFDAYKHEIVDFVKDYCSSFIKEIPSGSITEQHLSEKYMQCVSENSICESHLTPGLQEIITLCIDHDKRIDDQLKIANAHVKELSQQMAIIEQQNRGLREDVESLRHQNQRLSQTLDDALDKSETSEAQDIWMDTISKRIAHLENNK